MTASEPTFLDATEQEARIAKLNAERSLLENQLSKSYRRLEILKAVGVPITAVAADAGLLFSTTQWYIGNKATRAAQRQENVEHQLERLASSEPSQRITAVASLKSALSAEDAPTAEQTVAALTQLLATENSFAVRNSIVSALSRISSSSAEKRRTAALIELADVSRGLVSEGKLWHLERAAKASPPEPSSAAARALSVGNAIATLLRQGARSSNLAGIYLAGEDLTKLRLAGIDFQRAILVETQFDRAVLDASIFDDAVLAGTSFRNAHLHNASFRQAIGIYGPEGRTNYVFDQALPLQQSPEAHVTVIGPIFDGADLTGSTFEGHPLLPIYDNEMHQHAIITGFSFTGARLTGVDLRKMWAFGLRRRDIRLPNCDMQWRVMPSLISFGGMPLELLAGKVVNEPPRIEPLVQCHRTLELLGTAFSHTTRSKDLSVNFVDAAAAASEQPSRR